MLRRILYTLMVCLVGAGTAFAQTGTLTGTVTDASDGEILPGVNIYLVELQRGGATDVNGEYKIAGLPSGTYTLRISFIGYKGQKTTVSIQGDTELNFELEEDLIGLEEVIVTGQGGAIQSKRLSTTVDVISTKTLEATPASQLDQILQANLPNSQIRLSSGQPGTASLIRGRGVNSALTSTNPVIYIDGVRVDNTTGAALGIDTGGALSSSIADIPVDNIERIEFVKGGAATTLYGSDAANGVIQIFTKKGVQGASRFSFETNIGAVIGTEDFLHYKETADILFRPGLTQKYTLSASGGTEDLTYSFSGYMADNDGFRPNNDQTNHGLRTTVRAQLSNSVRYTGSLGFVSTEFERDNNANSSWALFGGLETLNFGVLDEMDAGQLADVKSQVAEISSLLDITEDTKRFQTSQQLDFDIIQGLTAKALVGLDSRATRQRWVGTNQYQIALGAISEGITDEGFIDVFERNYLGVTLETSAQYRFDVGDFSTVSVLGGQLFRTDDRQLLLQAVEVPDGIKTLNSAGDVSTTDFRRTMANYGVYFQENIGYKDRYFIEFGVRADGNTAFGAEVGTQWYPKVGASYALSSESFFQEIVPSHIISNLKLRGNIGYAGNFPTPFTNQVLANIDPFLGAQSMEFGTPGDPGLKPEKSRTIEVGADLVLANSRVSIEFTYFNTITDDALFNSRFASSTGYRSALQNVGKIENKGIELSSRFFVIQKRDLGLSFNASFNTLENVVLESGGAPFSTGGFSFLGAFVEEGMPIGYFRGHQPVFSEDGSEITEIISNDVLGNAIPEYYGTLGLNFNYKNLSLTATADYQYGAQAIYLDEVLRYLSGVPTEDLYPEAALNYGGSFFDLAGVWVHDADYLKVRFISLDYQIPEQYYRGIVRRINVGASVSNPFNFASTPFDPEISGASIGGQGSGPEVGVGGFSYSTASPPRTFLGTVRIGF